MLDQTQKLIYRATRIHPEIDAIIEEKAKGTNYNAVLNKELAKHFNLNIKIASRKAVKHAAIRANPKK